MLINDILDLSKIESGTVVLDVGELRFTDLHNYVDRTFRHVAEAKGVEFVVESIPTLPRDAHDRQQAAAADHQEPALQRVQVHASRPGQLQGRPGAPTAGIRRTNRSARATA